MSGFTATCVSKNLSWATRSPYQHILTWFLPEFWNLLSESVYYMLGRIDTTPLQSVRSAIFVQPPRCSQINNIHHNQMKNKLGKKIINAASQLSNVMKITQKCWIPVCMAYVTCVFLHVSHSLIAFKGVGWKTLALAFPSLSFSLCCFLPWSHFQQQLLKWLMRGR